MDNSSDEEDACEPTTKPNAFDVLMAPPAKKAKVVDGVVDPIYIAVIYIRWLKWIDPSAPLYGCPYVGQAVRAGNTAEEVAAVRWAEENQQALREDKHVGLIHEIKVHGATAFDSQVVEWKQGPRSEVQAWADEREIALISERGGPLRDPSMRCKQTLNLTKGGKGHVNFEAIDAARTVAWLKFQDEMEEYIECYETSLVPVSYANPVSGYKLGETLGHVRFNGTLWKGHPDEANRIAWLETLPGWAWKVREAEGWHDAASERIKAAMNRPEVKAASSARAKKQFESQEARDAMSERSKAMWANADEETRAEWARKNSEAKSTPEAKAAASERGKKQFESQEARDALSERAKKQFESQEARDAVSDRAKAQWANADEETRVEWRRKTSEAMNRAEVKAASSARGKKQFESQEARDALSDRGKAQATREAAEGKTSLAERGKATRTENWTKEQHDAVQAKRDATAAAKRAAVLSALPESERPKKQAEFDRNDLKEANRKSKANALLQLPSYGEKGYRWCYRHQAQAQKDGVVFFQDSSGVWCARACGDQGGSQGAGSSEHAKITVVAPVAEELEAEDAEAPEEPGVPAE
jgi:hypothetical protein